MIGATPQFPAIDMESARRRGALLYGLLIALACTAAGAGIVLAILKMW